MDLLIAPRVVQQQLLDRPLDGQISSVNGGEGYKTNDTVQRKRAALTPDQQIMVIATSMPELLIYRTCSKTFL